MDKDLQRAISMRSARRIQSQHTKDILHGGKLTQENAMRIVWKKGFIWLILTAGIIWMLLILIVLLFHIWSCQSSVAFFFQHSAAKRARFLAC